MDTLILGLLILKSFTVYEIRNFLRDGMYLMYSDSMGSIQSAIKKLLKDKHITFCEYVENGKNKKVYSITEEGKAYFLQWLSEPFSYGSMSNREPIKIFFMGMLPPEAREAIIKSYISILQQKLDLLYPTQEKAKGVVVENKLKDIASFQLATIRLSVESIQFEMAWYTSLLEKMKKGEELS